MEELSAAESVTWWLAGVGSMVPFLLIRLCIVMFRRGAGDIAIPD